MCHSETCAEKTGQGPGHRGPQPSLAIPGVRGWGPAPPIWLYPAAVLGYDRLRSFVRYIHASQL
jgi:hypothetical protein